MVVQPPKLGDVSKEPDELGCLLNPTQMTVDVAEENKEFEFRVKEYVLSQETQCENIWRYMKSATIHTFVPSVALKPRPRVQRQYEQQVIQLEADEI